ncbi:hypothetical protein [Magnetospirillum molischianum]|uniref:Uncharacterized protein n=1 Tax=Magnetospirillum molischianum DSM 120 TaxID=1150626 RepID=H8FTX9_MAGML|nr:hypothetical protein [Magnetospirillum molischianum]CCG41836.1 hypothetical protein PHAMO_290124 [Magnetospirillum molischianum DSM 120]
MSRAPHNPQANTSVLIPADLEFRLQVEAIAIDLKSMTEAAAGLAELVANSCRSAETNNDISFGPWRGLEWVLDRLSASVRDLEALAEAQFPKAAESGRAAR